MNYNSFEHFEADKYMRSIGSTSLVSDVETKMIYFEDKAFRIVASSILISLLILLFNYLW